MIRYRFIAYAAASPLMTPLAGAKTMAKTQRALNSLTSVLSNERLE